MLTDSNPVPLPRFTDPGEIDLSVIHKSFEKSPELSLGQPWFSTSERDFQSGCVLAAWCPEYLHILANLADEDIVLSGPQSGTSSLTIADVFQVFVERPENGDYLEIHVTPDNQARTIAWTPGRLADFRDGNISIDEILIDNDNNLFTQTWVQESEGSWHAYLRVPLSLINPKNSLIADEKCLRGTFCRFDASPDSVAPVLSSTSNFENGPKFHESENWHSLHLVDG